MSDTLVMRLLDPIKIRHKGVRLPVQDLSGLVGETETPQGSRCPPDLSVPIPSTPEKRPAGDRDNFDRVGSGPSKPKITLSPPVERSSPIACSYLSPLFIRFLSLNYALDLFRTYSFFSFSLSCDRAQVLLYRIHTSDCLPAILASIYSLSIPSTLYHSSELMSHYHFCYLAALRFMYVH